MSENETIADIVAELQRCGDKWIDDKTKTTMECLGLIAIHSARRIEAAWKRERETVTDCNHLGNAAAMREALEMCVEAMCRYCRAEARECGLPQCLDGCETLKIAKAALAAPPRNCDRHGGWLTALKRFNDTDGRNNPWGDDVFDTSFLDWLFAPATEGGAK